MIILSFIIWIIICVILFRPPKPQPAPRKPKDSDIASSYAEEVTAGQIRPPWQMLKTNDALPPRALTVTSVTQSHDLQVMESLCWKIC